MKVCHIAYAAMGFLVLAGAAPPLSANPPAGNDPPGKSAKQASPQHQDGGSTVDGWISAGISIGDARLLAGQYGLGGGTPLPPGIRKNLARGKPLPPGIAMQQMPAGFIQHLPQHPGYEWQRAGTDLVLVVQGGLVVHDVLEGVFD
jgi:hypothetical protein